MKLCTTSLTSFLMWLLITGIPYHDLISGCGFPKLDQLDNALPYKLTIMQGYQVEGVNGAPTSSNPDAILWGQQDSSNSYKHKTRYFLREPRSSACCWKDRNETHSIRGTRLNTKNCGEKYPAIDQVRGVFRRRMRLR